MTEDNNLAERLEKMADYAEFVARSFRDMALDNDPHAWLTDSDKGVAAVAEMAERGFAKARDLREAAKAVRGRGA